MVTLYLLDGIPKHFGHEIDAMEWVASDQATVEPPKGARKVETPVVEKARPAETYDEAVAQFKAPDVEVTAPKNHTPRHRNAE